MSRRVWIIAAAILTAPGLLCTGMLAVALLHAVFVAADGSEWWIENRIAGPLWVTPLGLGDRGPVPLPHYPTRLAMYTAPPFGAVLLRPGERRRLVLDRWAQTDVGGPPGVAVRTAAGEHWYCEGLLDGPGVLYPLDGSSLRQRATEEMVAAVQRSGRPVLFGIPFGVVLVVGVAAPLTLLGLRRAYRKLTPTP
jgi:hypothetical protein